LVDQRGTGKSAPAVFDSTTINIDLTLKDFEAVREQLGFKDWNVLGFSYGGFLASVYGEKYPSSVSSLITLGSMGFDFSTFRYFSDNIMSKLWQSDLDALEYWSDSARYASNPHHATVETIRAMMPGYFFNREKALIEGKNMKDSDFDFEMGNWIWIDIQKKYLDFGKKESVFNKPVLVIQGRQDPTGEGVAINNSNYYKNSTLVFVEKCGHYSWIEQPEKILIMIMKFLEQDK
jgi:proline iminopeptidase